MCLRTPRRAKKVVDYIEVEYEPIYAPSKAEPRDFAVSDVLLRVVAPSLKINGTDVAPASTIANMSLKSKLVWLAVPGRGRFLFSLYPYPGYGFQHSGVINRFGFSLVTNGDKFELVSEAQVTEGSGNWNLYVLSAPNSAGNLSEGFSYGELNSVEEFVSKIP